MSCSINRKTTLRRPWLLPVLTLCAALAAAFCGGCVTTDDSDIPWNAPQPWEGSPNIPGLQGN
jgi:hypothetical protein